MKFVWTGSPCRLIGAFALVAAVAVTAAPLVLGADTPDPDRAPGRTMAQQATKEQAAVDHHRPRPDRSAAARISAPARKSPRPASPVTRKRPDQFHKTIHWTWKAYTTENGQRSRQGRRFDQQFLHLGQQHAGQRLLLSCHPGWGNQTEAVNCLNCHGQEKSINWEESFEDLEAFDGSEDPDEQEIADEIRGNIQNAVQSVVRPERQNCGSCHFKGGGGDGVKHGDLDTSLTKPNKALDVHMGSRRPELHLHPLPHHHAAQHCRPGLHPTGGHRAQEPDRGRPDHQDHLRVLPQQHAAQKAESKANDHTDKVACQSCHIPEFARVNPTKMSWDWSQSGKLKTASHTRPRTSSARTATCPSRGR
jgi:hypothetical protein